MKLNRKIIILILSIFSLGAIICVSLGAWFYYATRDVTINTGDELEITTNLYKLDNYEIETPKSLGLYEDNTSGVASISTTWTEGATYYSYADSVYTAVTPKSLGLYIFSETVYQASTATAWEAINYYSYNSTGSFSAVELENSKYTVSTEVSFFQWGDEFITETTDATYYALECILDSNLYSSGRFKAVLSATMTISSDFSFDFDSDDVADSYLKFPLVKLSYAIADTPNVIIDSDECTTAVKAASYTELAFTYNDSSFTKELSHDTNSSYILNSSISKSYDDAEDTTFLNDDNYIRIIFYLKAEADTDAVNTYMDAYNALNIGYGNTLNINVANSISLTGAIRSIPLKES